MIYFPETIEEIDREFITSNTGVFSLLGFTWKKTKPNSLEILTQLVSLGFYHSKLSFYSIESQEKIISTILKRSSGGNWNSYYLQISPDKEENLKILLSSELFKNMFPENIEKIESEFLKPNAGLFSSLGFTWKKTKPNSLEILTQLVSLGIYPSKLSFYSPENQEKIISTILKRRYEYSWKSYYLSISPDKEENKLIFKQSIQFKEFLKKESKKKVQGFLKRYNFSESILQEKTKFSVLHSIWREEEINYLIQLYERNSDNLIKEIKTTDLTQKEFGRSKEAVLSKLNSLINESISKGTKYEIDSRGITSFPNEIEKYFNELVNYSELHSQNTMLEEFPVLSYNYPYNKTLTDESCFVLIIPFEFKGNSLEKYKPFEQHIISRLYSKLIDINSDELIETNNI